MGRENAVRVTLTDDELARLDALRARRHEPSPVPALAPPRTADRPRGRHPNRGPGGRCPRPDSRRRWV